ncbi:hypothetical protein PQX77_017537 [Marasmius sp. AFHP31]|nr:hypothetical protein PQX77_017537 [Marasmius sp. AFHP31]
MAAYPIQNPNLLINMLNLQKYFGKDLFNGVSKTEGLWECLIGEWEDIPPPEGTTSSRTTGTGDNARMETTTTPPSEKEIEDWEEKHLPWKRANSQLKGFMQLTLTRDCKEKEAGYSNLYIPLKDMTAGGAWTFMKENWGKPTLSTIYGDFLKAVTFTIDQNNPLALILVQAIPKVWGAAASKSLHDYSHESDDDDASSNDGNDNIKIPCAPGIQDTIMVEYECLNPQFAGCLTAVKRGGTNTPSFQQQQQRPRPPQRQQHGQQQNN